MFFGVVSQRLAYSRRRIEMSVHRCNPKNPLLPLLPLRFQVLVFVFCFSLILDRHAQTPDPVHPSICLSGLEPETSRRSADAFEVPGSRPERQIEEIGRAHV